LKNNFEHFPPEKITLYFVKAVHRRTKWKNQLQMLAGMTTRKLSFKSIKFKVRDKSNVEKVFYFNQEV
jgi:hypothetical protein